MKDRIYLVNSWPFLVRYGISPFIYEIHVFASSQKWTKMHLLQVTRKKEFSLLLRNYIKQKLPLFTTLHRSMYNALKYISDLFCMCLFVFVSWPFLNDIWFLVIIFYMFIIALWYFFFPSNFRELIDELQAKVQWALLSPSFFFAVISAYNQKIFKLFLLCFVLLDVFCLLKSKGTMASAATNNNHLFFSWLESFLTKCSSHSTPTHNMFLIPYSVGFQQTCHHPPPPPPPCLF